MVTVGALPRTPLGELTTLPTAGNPGFAKWEGDMASASLNGSLGPGQSPERRPGAEPLVGGHGAKPAEAESFFVHFHTNSGQKLRI